MVYKQLKQEILISIQALSEKHNLSLHKKVVNEKDMANMKSILTEFHFGLFFDKFCSTLQYDTEIFSNSDKTPDWILRINGQTIVAEVCRLNPAENDQKIQDAESWAIKEFRIKNPGVPVIGNFHLITQKPLKLKGESGALAVKANKYGSLVSDDRYPFLICLYFDFLSGHDKMDLFTCLYGHSVEFGGYISHPDFPLGTKYHDLTEGLFYCNEQVRENVSGVLLKTEDEFIYFHNYNLKNRLNKVNTSLFMDFSLDYYKF